MSLQDILAQAYYRIKVPLFEWKEQRWVRRHFYSDPLFKALDEELLAGSNPYPLSHVFPYGETPLQVLYAIAQKVNLKPTDRFVDLGCGRGRAVFFLSHFFGCQAIGVDLTPSFIKRAKQLANTFQQTKVSFECQDFLSFDFQKATCVYLYGTTYSDECLNLLEDRLQKLPEGSSVITVSAPLNQIRHDEELEGDFPWGKGTVFLHTKSSNMMPAPVPE